MTYHKAVLLTECIEGLNIKPNGIYVDVTFGGGGHSREILKHLVDGKLFAFDRDDDVLENIPNDKKFKLIQTNYKNIKRFLRLEGITKIDGILADLGVSSHQFDVAERGFSFRFEAELDMRMNTSASLSARKVVNEYSEEDLVNLFFKYGEIRISRKVAQLILLAREKKEIVTTTDLLEILDGVVPEKKKNQFLSQVFQSIRIEVNQEIESLKQMLIDGVGLLNVGGRFVVLSYHSLEDRLVKNIFKRGNLSGEIKKDFFGNILKEMREVNRKVIVASEKEQKENNRSRSSKLRIAEKVEC
ncbi:MAG: 16S rRNA (cytosine(1402)-N(4))-methyltransferase RsmH [Flavobacteriales bacterium]|nr:16S rRNA (cytosine(1402)-N(4))-methyltransferase RsmH [Flavobacteriales bacterium]MBT5699424.1 16S rRNA (cytosine(1402)-N(4))-methyltransferase RsmH [Flavobacteriales bacterium]MBT7726104.1 16S rRNA (cytosine(1402)-N(4))-methyltransferase RsmH [Flavobacteriales bacterium]